MEVDLHLITKVGIVIIMETMEQVMNLLLESIMEPNMKKNHMYMIMDTKRKMIF